MHPLLFENRPPSSSLFYIIKFVYKWVRVKVDCGHLLQIKWNKFKNSQFRTISRKKSLIWTNLRKRMICEQFLISTVHICLYIFLVRIYTEIQAQWAYNTYNLFSLIAPSCLWNAQSGDQCEIASQYTQYTSNTRAYLYYIVLYDYIYNINLYTYRKAQVNLYEATHTHIYGREYDANIDPIHKYETV